MSERLTMRDLTDAQMTLARLVGLPGVLERWEQAAELNQKVKVFEAAVWFPHLQKQVNGTDQRGMSGKCRDVKVMTWCCAGRCLIQLERPGTSITLITADDEGPWRREMAHVAPSMGPMGIQNVDAEYLDVLRLLYEVTRYGSGITLSPDPDVTIG
jgi:hypothetical protein